MIELGFDFERRIHDILRANLAINSVKPLNLGGVTSSGGGTGGPIGGFVGQLPQTYVTYDLSEAEIDTPFPLPSSVSLVNNLNRIRYRLAVLEAGGGGSGINAFLELMDAPSSYDGEAGKVVVVNQTESGLEFTEMTAGSGTGAEIFTDLTDVPSSYTDQEGKVLKVNSTADGLEFADDADNGAQNFIELSDVPSSYTDQEGKVVVVNSTATGLIFATQSSGSGAGVFTELTDVPSSYETHAGKMVVVNSEETGLTFATTSSGGGGSQGFYTITTTSSGIYTWDLSNGSAKILLKGDTQITSSNMSSVIGNVVFLEVMKEDGAYALTFDDEFFFTGGVQPTISTVSGTRDVLVFACSNQYLFSTNIVTNLLNNFSPVGISNLAVWLDADDISGSADDPISTWADKSGNGNDFSSEDNGRRPLLKLNSINGHKSLLFDNSDDSLVSAYEIDTSPYSLFIVAKAYDTTGGYHKILTQGGWWDYGQMDGDKVYCYNYNEYQSGTGVAADTFLISHHQNYVGEGTCVGEFRVNGSTVASRTDFSYPTEPLMVGYYDSDQCNSYVAEIIIYEKDLSASEVMAVENYLIAKYAIT